MEYDDAPNFTMLSASEASRARDAERLTMERRTVKLGDTLPDPDSEDSMAVITWAMYDPGPIIYICKHCVGHLDLADRYQMQTLRAHMLKNIVLQTQLKGSITSLDLKPHRRTSPPVVLRLDT